MAAAKDVGPRIGADPEVFIREVGTKQIAPVCGLIGGTKAAPIKLDVQIAQAYGPERGPRGRGIIEPRGFYGVQEDNVMLEFNVPAYKEIALFTSAISKSLEFIQESLLLPKGYEYCWGADHAFDTEVLSKHPQALEIGCSPDFYAYAEENRFKREPFSAATFGNRRFCGGHLHVQYDKDNVPPHVFAQFMDCIASLPYLEWDKQGLRRLYYGQPGLFREKDYGIEYRTLSNFWVYPKFRETYLLDLADNVFHLALMANTDPGFLMDVYSKVHWEDVQQSIRLEDHKTGNELVAYFREKLRLHVNPVPKRSES